MPLDARPPGDADRRKRLVTALRRLREPGAALGMADRALVPRPAVVRRVEAGYRGVCALDWPVAMTLVQSGWVELWRETGRVMVFRISAAGEAHLCAELVRLRRERRLWREAAA